MSQGDLITGLALAGATPVPFFIQVYICSRLRSFEGISFASLIMGNLCMSTQIVNAIALKWKQLQYCSSAGYSACQPSMVDLYQFAAVWLSFLPLIFQVSIMRCASSHYAPVHLSPSSRLQAAFQLLLCDPLRSIFSPTTIYLPPHLHSAASPSRAEAS
jgi:hypothetical protein